VRNAETGSVNLNDARRTRPAHTELAGIAQPHRRQQASVVVWQAFERGTLDRGSLASAQLRQRDPDRVLLNGSCGNSVALAHRGIILRLSLNINVPDR